MEKPPEQTSDASEQTSSDATEPKKRRLITRRRVLIGAGGVVASGALAAGGLALLDQHQRFGRDAESTIPDHRVDLPMTTPRMVYARGTDPARNTRAVIERMGGMRQFVTPADVVLIKPNIGWQRNPEQAATTHPDVVAELVRLCRDTGAKRVLVSDCPVRKSRGAFERSGILEAASNAGAEVIIPEDSTHRVVTISERLGTWDILEPFVTATKIINVPIAKHHALFGIAAGMKNWIGITNKLRLMFHNDINQSIAELAALMRPTLTVMDASRVLMHNGPEGGSLDDVKQINTVAASIDPVALDAWACGLVGKAPDALPAFLALGQSMGLGTTDYASLNPIEVVPG